MRRRTKGDTHDMGEAKKGDIHDMKEGEFFPLLLKIKKEDLR